MKTLALEKNDFSTDKKLLIQERTKINSLGCWIWQGAKNPKGYGKININYKTVASHRLSYVLFNGDIKAGLYVCHTCDNPSCINPKHLFLGTAQDNTHDCFNKGRDKRKGRKLSSIHRARIGDFQRGKSCPQRGRKGGENPSAKLNSHSVIEIRRKHAAGIKMKDLVSEYKVHRSTILCIIKRKTWKHI